MTTNVSTKSPVLQSHIESLKLTQGLFKASLQGDLTEKSLVFQVAPSKTHILWAVGHLAYALDRVLNPVLGIKPTLSEREVELFGTGSQPLSDRSAYPSLQELIGKFDNLLAATLGKLETLSENDLGKPLPEDSPLKQFVPTVGMLLHASVFHIGYHAGQVSLLRRAQGLGTGFGM